MTPPKSTWPFRLGAYALLLLVAAVLAALLTPSTDAVAMTELWLPILGLLWGLFEAGFFIYRRNKSKDQD